MIPDSCVPYVLERPAVTADVTATPAPAVEPILSYIPGDRAPLCVSHDPTHHQIARQVVAANDPEPTTFGRMLSVGVPEVCNVPLHLICEQGERRYSCRLDSANGDHDEPGMTSATYWVRRVERKAPAF